MTIGVDISALQTGHRMRGIGYTIFNFINNISPGERQSHRFVFYLFEEEVNKALELLDLEGMAYEIRYLPATSSEDKSFLFLPGRLRRLLRSIVRQLGQLRDLYTGSSLIKNTSGLDVFLQPDQSKSLPRGRKIKKAFIIYDIIPYVLEWDYLWNYRTARLRGLSRKAALRCSVRRELYLKKLKIGSRRADLLLSISEATKHDFINYVRVPQRKIKVVHLGVSPPSKSEASKSSRSVKRYYDSSWGYLPRNFQMDLDTPFLLYVGGADRRRKLQDLVAAYNLLRAEGIKINLVMAGDIMEGPNHISTEEIRDALNLSSYKDDIIFLGFTDDSTRDWLYKKAFAYIYPSRYEGFGLPVLEAMSYGTPVVAYKNAATFEVAAEVPLYADDAGGIKDSIERLIDNPKLARGLKDEGLAQAARYSWQKTSREILEALV